MTKPKRSTYQKHTDPNMVVLHTRIPRELKEKLDDEARRLSYIESRRVSAVELLIRILTAHFKGNVYRPPISVEEANLLLERKIGDDRE